MHSSHEGLWAGRKPWAAAAVVVAAAAAVAQLGLCSKTVLSPNALVPNLAPSPAGGYAALPCQPHNP